MMKPAVSLAPDLAAAEALRAEWLDLYRRAEATPFQAPGCLLPWARGHAPDRLAAAVVREGERPVGLVPVFSWQGAVLLAGTGPTDYNDGLFEPGRIDAAALALEELARLADARGCERIDLHQLRPESLLLAAPAPEGWTAEIAPGDVCPVAPVTGPDGLGAMPDKWRKKLAYTRRKVERAGGFSVQLAGPDTVDAIRESLLDLHARRWRELGQPGVLVAPLMRDFLAQALPELLTEGALRLWALRLRGEIAAVVCSLQDGRAAHMYLTGFDPAQVALGPGTLLIAHVIEQAARDGVGEIRFLRGEEPYKANWGAVPRPTYRRMLSRV